MSRRTRSTTARGVRVVADGNDGIGPLLTGASAAALPLELQGEPPYLAVERADLGTQPVEVGARREVYQVPHRADSPCARSRAKRLRLGRAGHAACEMVGADQGPHARCHGPLGQVEDLPPRGAGETIVEG
jgi:hypothetical protein